MKFVKRIKAAAARVYEGERPRAEPDAQSQLGARPPPLLAADVPRRRQTHQDRDAAVRAQLHLDAHRDAPPARRSGKRCCLPSVGFDDRCHSGEGALKMTDMKLQDLKLTGHRAGHEFARDEIAGLKLPDMK